MASQSIDELSIEIGYKSEDASKGITSLATSLKSLSDATTGLTTKMKNLSTNLSSLRDAVKYMRSSSFDKIGTIAQSLKPLETLGKPKLTSFINQLTKLKEVNDQLKPEIIAEFGKKVQDLTTILTPLATNMNAISKGFSKLPTYINNTTNRMVKYNQTAKATSSINKKLNLAAIGTVFTRLGRIIGGFVSQSNSYVENLNLFRVAMGESTEQAEKFINTVSGALGLDPSEMQRYMGVFQMIASGFGLSAENAYKMSKNLTQLTYDISSFYNINIDEAAQKVQSAIAGKIICLIYKGLYIITYLIAGTPKRVMA